MVYVRLDFSITVDEGAEAKMKVAGYCEKVVNLQDKRSSLYQAMEDAMVRLKSCKDANAFQTTLKKIMADLKTHTTAISDLQSTIKNVNAELGERVGELQHCDKVYRDCQGQQAALVEKLVTGKLQKTAYLDQEAVILKKKDEISDRMTTIVRAL